METAYSLDQNQLASDVTLVALPQPPWSPPSCVHPLLCVPTGMRSGKTNAFNYSSKEHCSRQSLVHSTFSSTVAI